MALASEALPGRINLDVPRWDQSTFSGRFKHFFAITDWRKALYTNKQLDDYKDIVNLYRCVALSMFNSLVLVDGSL